MRITAARAYLVDIDVEQVRTDAVRSFLKQETVFVEIATEPGVAEDLERLTAVHQVVGPHIDLMVDANQSFTPAEARRRAAVFAPLDLAWFEEPVPADDVAGHARLAASTTIPVAVGESLYSEEPGLGIDWDRDAVDNRRVA